MIPLNFVVSLLSGLCTRLLKDLHRNILPGQAAASNGVLIFTPV